MMKAQVSVGTETDEMDPEEVARVAREVVGHDQQDAEDMAAEVAAGRDE